jgi:hypothetical protein
VLEGGDAELCAHREPLGGEGGRIEGVSGRWAFLLFFDGGRRPRMYRVFGDESLRLQASPCFAPLVTHSALVL